MTAQITPRHAVSPVLAKVHNSLRDRGYSFEEARGGILGARQPGEWRVACADRAEAWILARRQAGAVADEKPAAAATPVTTPAAVAAPAAAAAAAAVSALTAASAAVAAPAAAAAAAASIVFAAAADEAAPEAAQAAQAAGEEPTWGPAVLLDSWGNDISLRMGSSPAEVLRARPPACRSMGPARPAVGPARGAVAAAQPRPIPAPAKHQKQTQYCPAAPAIASAPVPAPTPALANSLRPRVGNGNSSQPGHDKRAAQSPLHSASKSRVVMDELPDSLPIAAAAATAANKVTRGGSEGGFCSRRTFYRIGAAVVYALAVRGVVSVFWGV